MAHTRFSTFMSKPAPVIKKKRRVTVHLEFTGSQNFELFNHLSLGGGAKKYARFQVSAVK